MISINLYTPGFIAYAGKHISANAETGQRGGSACSVWLGLTGREWQLPLQQQAPGLKHILPDPGLAESDPLQGSLGIAVVVECARHTLQPR
jgi:hypothetical protein